LVDDADSSASTAIARPGGRQQLQRMIVSAGAAWTVSRTVGAMVARNPASFLGVSDDAPA